MHTYVYVCVCTCVSFSSPTSGTEFPRCLLREIPTAINKLMHQLLSLCRNLPSLSPPLFPSHSPVLAAVPSRICVYLKLLLGARYPPSVIL